jgi:predicted transcriptional regulator of viral defense system
MNDLLTFNGLSKKEVGIISRLSFEGKNIISTSELKNYIPADYKNKNKFISNLRKKNILSPIKRGFYIFNTMGSLPKGRKLTNYLIPNIYFPKQNYYIGYAPMFNYYGFTEQVFQSMVVINTSITGTKEINDSVFQFIRVKNEYMYGIIPTMIMNETVMISDRERTMIDMMYWYEAVGGLKQASGQLQKEIIEKRADLEKFIDYAIRFPKLTVRKLIGVVLDKAEISEALTQPLYDSIKNSSITSVRWDSRKGTINKKWRVITNDFTS